MKHTEKQVSLWERYERVRASAEHNMMTDGVKLGKVLGPESALKATGLSVEEYKFVQKNYDTLRSDASVWVVRCNGLFVHQAANAGEYGLSNKFDDALIVSKIAAEGIKALMQKWMPQAEFTLERI